MAVTTSAKRGEARGAASPPSHIKREVIGVVLIALALLTLLSLASFVPGELKAGTASTPPIADRFAALLAAEQGERPSTATAAPPSPPATPTAIPDAIVDEITTKVLEKLSDTVVRDTVAQLVSRIAERLVRDEIARIKGVST